VLLTVPVWKLKKLSPKNKNSVSNAFESPAIVRGFLFATILAL
jgi:hypothetical protein